MNTSAISHTSRRKNNLMQDVIIIEAGRSERHYWLDLWRYRELFRVLAWRDLSVRYKQTVIGVLWALIRPFLTMLVFTVIFGRIAKLPTDGNAPYALMVFAGILPWTFFSTGLSEASNSLINNTSLISKVYFPRLIVPIATIVVAFVDFLISFCILLVLMGWYRFLPDWRIIVLPVFAIIGVFCQRRSGALDYLPQCKIPGFSLRYPIHRAVRPLRVAGRIQFKRGARAMAVVIFAQSNGGRDRRIPLVHTSRTKRTVPARSVGQHCRDCFFPMVRSASVPKDGKKLRGPDLSAT